MTSLADSQPPVAPRFGGAPFEVRVIFLESGEEGLARRAAVGGAGELTVMAVNAGYMSANTPTTMRARTKNVRTVPPQSTSFRTESLR
jgi:hypothetical protein